jgi:hypothetical protein
MSIAPPSPFGRHHSRLNGIGLDNILTIFELRSHMQPPELILISEEKKTMTSSKNVQRT